MRKSPMTNLVIINDFLQPEGTEKLMFGMLRDAGIEPRDATILTIFPFRCHDVRQIVGPKSEGIPGTCAVKSGKYVKIEYSNALKTFRETLSRLRPNLVLCLGAVACWSLGIPGNLTRIRGASLRTIYGKAFPTYHPSDLFRDWSRRPILLADLAKAAKEATFPEIRRPLRTLWLEPSLDDLARFEREHIIPARRVSVDIETSGNYVTCIGFAPTMELAIVIPFILSDKKPYWETVDDELSAWDFVRRWCYHSKIIGQNFLYDAHRLWRGYGITTPNLVEDTMLLHHALFIELEKGLGFLGSVYTSEARWKFMRDVDTLKRGDE